MFWNKTLLKWEEPRFAEKYVARHLSFRDYLLAFGKVALKLGVGTYLVVLFLRWLKPLDEFRFFSFEALGVALFIVVSYLLLSLMMFAGSKLSRPQVALREKSLTYLSVEGNAAIPYRKMESFSLLKTNLEGMEFYVLSVKDWDGNEIFIEIDPKINNESISEILQSRNVQMKTSLLNPY